MLQASDEIRPAEGELVTLCRRQPSLLPKPFWGLGFRGLGAEGFEGLIARPSPLEAVQHL